jgi:hypothetical protein
MLRINFSCRKHHGGFSLSVTSQLCAIATLRKGFATTLPEVLYRTAVLPQSVLSAREPALRQLPRHTPLISAVAPSCLAIRKGVDGEPDMAGMLGGVFNSL